MIQKLLNANAIAGKVSTSTPIGEGKKTVVKTPVIRFVEPRRLCYNENH